MAADIIYSMCNYLDGMERKGFSATTMGSRVTSTRGEDARQACRNWQAGTCRKGDRCKFKHVGEKGSKSKPAAGPPGKREQRAPPGGSTRVDEAGSSAQSRPGSKQPGAGSMRCRHDYAGKKCPYGDKCRFEYKNAAVNKIKQATPVAYSNHTCRAYGVKGHILVLCK